MTTERIDRLFYAEWGNPAGTAMDDVDAWYEANPALGIRVTEEALHDEYRTLVSGGDEDLIAEYSREAVGVGEEPEGDGRVPIIDPDDWAATASVDRRPDGRVVLAYDVDLKGESASIDWAAGHAAAPYLECLRHQQGVSWLGSELVALTLTHDPIAIGYNAAGPALEQLGSIIVAFREAKIDTDELFVPLTASTYRAACGGLLAHISGRTLTRPRLAQTPLDNAALDVTERPLAEGRVFHRRQATVPISPIVAGAVAVHLLPTPAPVVVVPSAAYIDIEDL